VVIKGGCLCARIVYRTVTRYGFHQKTSLREPLLKRLYYKILIILVFFGSSHLSEQSLFLNYITSFDNKLNSQTTDPTLYERLYMIKLCLVISHPCINLIMNLNEMLQYFIKAKS
jgi:hypothetical protein